jgi:hypothetical protein
MIVDWIIAASSAAAEAAVGDNGLVPHPGAGRAIDGLSAGAPTRRGRAGGEHPLTPMHVLYEARGSVNGSAIRASSSQLYRRHRRLRGRAARSFSGPGAAAFGARRSPRGRATRRATSKQPASALTLASRELSTSRPRQVARRQPTSEASASIKTSRASRTPVRREASPSPERKANALATDFLKLGAQRAPQSKRAEQAVLRVRREASPSPERKAQTLPPHFLAVWSVASASGTTSRGSRTPVRRTEARQCMRRAVAPNGQKSHSCWPGLRSGQQSEQAFEKLGALYPKLATIPRNR